MSETAAEAPPVESQESVAGESAPPIEADTPAENTEQTPQETSEDKPKEEKPRKRSRGGFQNRIDKLTRRTREQDALIAELQAALQPKDEPAQAPQADDFDDYEAYLEAKAAHVAEQRVQEAEEKRQAQLAEQAHQASVVEFQDARDELVNRGIDSFDDFEDVVFSDDLQISPLMAQAVVQADNGHEVMYHLGTNPDTAEKISRMNDYAQLIEIGRISAEVARPKAPSQAPPPITPVDGATPSTNALRDDMPIDEWMKKRREKLAS